VCIEILVNEVVPAKAVLPISDTLSIISISVKTVLF
jgi:hypothetical protein